MNIANLQKFITMFSIVFVKIITPPLASTCPPQFVTKSLLIEALEKNEYSALKPRFVPPFAKNFTTNVGPEELINGGLKIPPVVKNKRRPFQSKNYNKIIVKMYGMYDKCLLLQSKSWRK